ncbi:hypothetical protein NQ315_007081 [Exocentrus adspersus]|uniref:Lysosomal Pro-X carboxypeptidase n=1 Tax=Exocentrus adspersus TaxID=1586481 RepID=A0AAV8WDA0_9CUCU|nr:hypothetical protein NQ315_007081 [Exocentrus adspersus]
MLPLLVYLLLSLLVVDAQNDYTFTTKYIEIPLDHFSYTTNTTFKLRYLVNDACFGPNGTIFFYTGNQGDIEMYAQNTGFLFDIASQFNAVVVFAEHRYYGESKPFGDLSYSSPEQMGYLSSAQALADYVYLINDLQKNVPQQWQPAWLRMKYPNSVVGALASSAPIWQFKDQNPCDAAYKTATEQFATLGNKRCTDIIQKSWRVIRSYTQTNAGKINLANMWNFCEPFTTNEDIDTLIDWLSNIYMNVAAFNYPYPTNFVVPLGADPLAGVCGRLNQVVDDINIDNMILVGLTFALQVYTNYTQSVPCNRFDTLKELLGDYGWQYQACTELVTPECSQDTDMFESFDYDFETFSERCFKMYGVRPRNEEIPLLQYGDKDLSTAKNIIFSNGMLDPWSSYGVLTDVTTPNVVVVRIPEGVHHSDLRAGDPDDPESVKEARLIEIHHIKKWLGEYYNGEENADNSGIRLSPCSKIHFGVNTTFPLKYLVNDTFFGPNGTIFFYTGNEGDIEMFAQNSGFIFDIAPQFNALVVFAEHRYYGESMPFGNLSYSSPEYMGYLSSSQALADFVYLINDLQKTYASPNDTKKLPAIAFGGSYGGMLSAWLKMKYPNSVIGALASSAPIWMFKDQNPCSSFYKIVTDDFATLGSELCRDTIEKSWKSIRSYTQNSTGKQTLSSIWNFCEPLETDEDINTLIEWLVDIYVVLAETNYPYPTNFVVPLPGNPVKEFCTVIDDTASDAQFDIQVLVAIGLAMQVYTNYTKDVECNQLKPSSPQLGYYGWYFQECTEMVMPFCSEDTDMFENFDYDFQAFSEDCYKTYGVRPRSEEVPLLEYGDKDLSTAKNIIFSNGLLDPWSGYGVLTNVTPDIIAIAIPEAVHHSDLRASDPKDPESVKEARLIEIHHIKKWLDEYYSSEENNSAGNHLIPFTSYAIIFFMILHQYFY